MTHGRINWKGTDVCMDVVCKCGAIGHIDAEFTYNVKCGACGAVYECDPHVQLYELEKEPDNHVILTEVLGWT